ncbi:MAG: hypothetical protein M3Z09_05040 [Acidobacteriota bacterium]|nr:hypothetical protein [Acidobacteriota bacterium]
MNSSRFAAPLGALLLLAGSMPGAVPAKRRTRAVSVTPATSYKRTAARWMRGMSVRDQVAQLVAIPFSGRPLNTRSKAYRDFVRLVARDHVGGMILVNVSQGRLVQKAEPLDVAAFLNKMQRLAKVPLIVSADLERGASMRLNASTVFPHAMAFAAARDPAAVRTEGVVTAREARAVGIHWVFYPVADVNNNPDNPIINIRSFGENPDEVSTYVDAFIEGAHADTKNLVLTTAKHFPGHGDTSTDSHMNMATITADRERLNRLEFVPFRAAIEHGVDSVMTAHISVPALDDSGLPATLSPKIINGVLREELGFKGIVVTDALEMGGIAKKFAAGEAAVRAIQAGADVLLIPPDPHAAIEAVTAAVHSGKISRKRLEQSVMRVLVAKARLGLASRSIVNLEQVNEILNAPEANAQAQAVADHAVTLIKNEGALVPLRDPAKTCFLLLTESRTSPEGQAFAAEVHKRAPAAHVAILDSSMSSEDLAQSEQQNAGCEETVVGAFVSVAAYRGDVALGGNFPSLMERLISSHKPLALISLGNPYLLRNFSGVGAYLTTYSTVPPSEVAAVKALFGEIPMTGRLPVTIPGTAKYGDGLGAAP